MSFHFFPLRYCTVSFKCTGSIYTYVDNNYANRWTNEVAHYSTAFTSQFPIPKYSGHFAKFANASPQIPS